MLSALIFLNILFMEFVEPTRVLAYRVFGSEWDQLIAELGAWKPGRVR